MVTVSQSQPSAETRPVARPGPEAERTAALDLDALERKLSGAGGVMVCRHPDIDGQDIDSPTRSCVIDDGHADQCEFSDPGGPSPVLDKAECPNWALMLRRQPRRLSIKEGLALLALARASASDPSPPSAELGATGTNRGREGES